MAAVWGRGPRAARVNAVDEPGAEGSTAPGERGEPPPRPRAAAPPPRRAARCLRILRAVKPRRALTNASYRRPTRRVPARAARTTRTTRTTHRAPCELLC